MVPLLITLVTLSNQRENVDDVVEVPTFTEKDVRQSTGERVAVVHGST